MAAAAVGCATSTPLPAPPLLPSSASAADVPELSILADGTAWKGEPANLAEAVTPVYISIEHPKRISYLYADFALIGASGLRYPAVPASQLRPLGATTRLVPKYDRDRNVTFQPTAVPFEMSRTDLIDKALQLTPDGRGQGFVYFDVAAQREAEVWLELTVVNASTRQTLGRFAAPLRRWQSRGEPVNPLPNRKPAPCIERDTICTERMFRMIQ